MKRFVLLSTLLFCCCVFAEAKKDRAVVILTAGQSNTDGRVMNTELPEKINAEGYKYCQWSYGSGATSGNGQFEPFYPRIININNPSRYGYDAIVYHKLEQHIGKTFYVIKESLGGTAIDTTCSSRDNMYWSADPDFLSSTSASDKGGRSLLTAFTENIGSCIDNHLSRLPEGYDIKVLLWHQGESDRRAGKRYYANMKAVIEYVRNYLVEKTGKKKYRRLPVVLGGVVPHSKQYSRDVEEAKQRIASEDKNVYYVSTPHAPLLNDGLHFNAKGAEKLANKVYELLLNEKIL